MMNELWIVLSQWMMEEKAFHSYMYTSQERAQGQ